MTHYAKLKVKSLLYSQKIPLWTAWGIFGLVLLGFAGKLALDIAGCPPGQPLFPTNSIWGVNFSRILLLAVPPVAFSILGALVITFHPENRIGWLALLLGLVYIGSTISLEYGMCTYRGVLNLPAGTFVLWLHNIFTGLFSVIILLFITLFPNGRFISLRWKRLSLTMIGLLGLVAVLSLVWPGELLANLPGLAPELQNPFALPFEPSLFWDTVFYYGETLIGLIFGVLAILSLFVRWRQAHGEERQQIKWLALFFLTAGIVFITVETIGYTIYPEIFEGWFYIFELTVFFVGLPIILGLAIFKYRLYEIDIVIGRTIVYGLLTVTLIGIYFASAVLLQRLFTQITGAESPLAIVLSTLLIAALFQPLRQRLQRSVNRLLFGQRDDPFVVLAKLGDFLVSAESPSTILPHYADTIASALNLSFVAIQMRYNGRLIQAACAGNELHPTKNFSLTYHNKDVGRLIVSPKYGNNGFSPVDYRLLEQIANQTAAAVYAVQLNSQLQESRQQLVTTREEERRRLRRDLHDGLGPVLAGQGLKLTAARHLLDKNPGEVGHLLDEVMLQNEATVDEVRRLVYELRPPALDDLGLAGAIEQEGTHLMGITQLTISVRPLPLPDLPAAVEVAAYRIIMEALTNVRRHASAESCQVRIEAGRMLLLEVNDDGIGLNIDSQPGVGLTSMCERAAELGGEFSIISNNNFGTCIKVMLPC